MGKAVGAWIAGSAIGASIVASAGPFVRSASADVNLEFRPASQTVGIGAQVEIGVYAVSDDGSDQLLSAARVIVAWQNDKLKMFDLDNTGGASLWDSEFPIGDPFGLNEVVPPLDGDGIYQAVAMPGSPVAATPQGTLLTTLQFQALGPTSGTPVAILATGGSPQGASLVLDGTIPNLDITGTLSGATVFITGLVTCDGDFDSDGTVGVNDFLIMLAAWGPNPGHPADMDGDDVVAVSDFLILLSVWGSCP